MKTHSLAYEKAKIASRKVKFMGTHHFNIISEPERIAEQRRQSANDLAQKEYRKQMRQRD